MKGLRTKGMSACICDFRHRTKGIWRKTSTQPYVGTGLTTRYAPHSFNCPHTLSVYLFVCLPVCLPMLCVWQRLIWTHGWVEEVMTEGDSTGILWCVIAKTCLLSCVCVRHVSCVVSITHMSLAHSSSLAHSLSVLSTTHTCLPHIHVSVVSHMFVWCLPKTHLVGDSKHACCGSRHTSRVVSNSSSVYRQVARGSTCLACH